MTDEIEGTSSVVSVKSHIVEGHLLEVDGRFMLQDVEVGDRQGDLWVEDVLKQYVGEDIRIVVVSLKDAQRMLDLAKGMSDGGRDDRG